MGQEECRPPPIWKMGPKQPPSQMFNESRAIAIAALRRCAPRPSQVTDCVSLKRAEPQDVSKQNRSGNAAPGQQLEHEDDECDDQDEMNQGASDVEGEESERPENDENNEDGPEHIVGRCVWVAIIW